MEERIKMIKAMEYIARQINDEDVLGRWLVCGVADGDIDYIETLINTTKAFLPALVAQLKETRPEELVVQEIQRELEEIPEPKE